MYSLRWVDELICISLLICGFAAAVGTVPIAAAAVGSGASVVGTVPLAAAVGSGASVLVTVPLAAAVASGASGKGNVPLADAAAAVGGATGNGTMPLADAAAAEAAQALDNTFHVSMSNVPVEHIRSTRSLAITRMLGSASVTSPAKTIGTSCGGQGAAPKADGVATAQAAGPTC